MKRNIITLCLIVGLLIAVFSFMYYSQVGSTSNVQVSIESSSKFTEEELNEAIETVKKKFKEFKGCELTELWYSETKSSEFSKEYLNYGNGPDNLKEHNVMVLLSNFDVNSSGGDGSFEPNSTQSNWKWILIRDNNKDNWHVGDWGY